MKHTLIQNYQDFLKFINHVECNTDLYKKNHLGYPWYQAALENINLHRNLNNISFNNTKKKSEKRFKDFENKIKILNNNYEYCFISKAKQYRSNQSQKENYIFFDILKYLHDKNKKFIVFEIPQNDKEYDERYFDSRYYEYIIPYEHFINKYKHTVQHEISSSTRDIQGRFLYDLKNIPVEKANDFSAFSKLLIETYIKISNHVIPSIHIFKSFAEKKALKGIFGAMGTHYVSGLNNNHCTIEVSHGFSGTNGIMTREYNTNVSHYYSQNFNTDNFFYLMTLPPFHENRIFKPPYCIEQNVYNFGMPELRNYIYDKEKIASLKKKYNITCKNIILFATVGGKEHHTIAKLLKSITTTVDDTHILIRQHPVYDSPLIIEPNSKISFVNTENIYDILSISNIVISPPSSVVHEASIFTKNIILYLTNRHDNKNSFKSSYKCNEIVYIDEIIKILSTIKLSLYSYQNEINFPKINYTEPLDKLFSKIEINTKKKNLKVICTNKYVSNKIEFIKINNTSKIMQNNNNFIEPFLSSDFIDLYIVRKAIKEHIDNHLTQLHGTLLDVGCGQMPYRDYMLARNSNIQKYIGLDFPKGKYAERKQPDLTWNGTTIPLPDKSVDCAMATEVLEHCYEPLTVLKEIKRVLKPDGLFFFTTPFLWPLHDVPHDHFRYTPFSLERLLSESGFEDIQIKPLGGWNASLAQMLGLWLRRAPLTDSAREQAIRQLFPLYQQLAEMPEIEPESEQAKSMTPGWSGIAYCPSENCDTLPEIPMDETKNPRICIIRNKKFTYSETFIEDHINYISTNSFVIYGNPYPIYHKNDCLLKYENLTEEAFLNLKEESKIKIYSKILHKYIEENKIDIILVEYGNLAANIYKACEFTKTPYIIHFHGYDASAKEAIIGMKAQYLSMFKSCKNIIVVSKIMKETILKIGAPKDKVILNPYGVSIKNQNKARPDQNQPLFLAVGRFVNKKAPHLTIKAFSKALPSIKNAKLVMVGDGPLLNQCKKLAQSLKIEDSVHFAGIHSRRSVAKFMSLSRAFVQHSVTAPNGDCEGLPLAILEAGAMALPVISTRHAGIPDAVIEGEHGVLVDELDVNAMAQAIRTLGNDPDLAREMGSKYRSRIENNFSRNRSIQNLRRIIQDALSTDQQPESNDNKHNVSSDGIDFLACERHNYQHLLPVWNMIPENVKGNFYILTTIDEIENFTPRIENLIFCDSDEQIINILKKSKNILITSSFYDKFLTEIDRHLIFISHGGGQTYIGQNEYQLARRNYVLDLLPNHHTEKVFSVRYPYSKKVVIGSPKMDTWHVDFKKPKNNKPVIAISFHFDRKAIPESRSTWEHFSPIIHKLAKQDKWKILGHGHPRMMNTLAPVYNEFGIETVLDFEDVLKRADLYICDHMSTLYEFASTDRPVVVLNAPWYRRDVEHGLRFWEHADVGINCDHPDSLFEAIEHALADAPEQKAKRKKSVNGVYAYRDGQAAQRAAQAIVDFSAEWNKNPQHLYPNTSEAGIQAYLSDSDVSAETVIGLAEYHKMQISIALAAIKSDIPPHISDLEFHFWALVLFLCKLGKIPEAKQICRDFYLSFGGSEILSTMFRQTLLTPAQSKPKNANDPLVSVVIPLYNQGVYLNDSVKSVVNQSYLNWELIIVNDGSTDNSFETAQNLAQRYQNHSITILDQNNKGKGFTRNRGVSTSHGKYICILDADDMLGSTYLEEAVSSLEQNQEVGWITPITLQFGRVHQIFYNFDFDLKEMLTVCPSPITSIFRRELWDEVEGFDETMTDREDWEFWIKAAEAGWLSLHTDTPQFMYRIQEKRFGERSDVNINSKLEIIQRHPWWFKSMSREQLVSLCGQFSTCNFTPEILNTPNVQKMTDLPKNRLIRKRLFTQIKDDWMAQNSHAPQPAVNSKAASLLRLAAHYAEKGDHDKAERYREQARKSK